VVVELDVLVVDVEVVIEVDELVVVDVLVEEDIENPLHLVPL